MKSKVMLLPVVKFLGSGRSDSIVVGLGSRFSGVAFGYAWRGRHKCDRWAQLRVFICGVSDVRKVIEA